MEDNLRSVLHESSAVINPDAYARTFLSALQSSQLLVPSHSSSNAHSMALKDGEVPSRRMNQFPMELGRIMNDRPHEDNVAHQALTCTPQQDAPVPSASSTIVNLDALSRQIMMAGMAALGINNPALQQQFVLGESNTSSANPFFNVNNVCVPGTLGSSVQRSVPDGSGLLRYRAPEIDSFVYDRNTGYRFDPTSGLHYDANAGVFINVGQKIFMRWDPISNTYLKESKRSGPLQSAVPMSLALPTMNLNNHSTFSNTQAIPVTVYSTDMIQTLNATSSDALLIPPSVVNQTGQSTHDGNVILPIPAEEHISQEESRLKALWQQMISFEKEVESSKKNQVPEVVRENKVKDEKEWTEPKQISRTSKKSSDDFLDSDPSDSHRVGRRSRSRSKSSTKRTKGGHRRSKSRSDSQIRKRSRSQSQEARSMKRSRRSHSRENRRQKSRETRRSRSRGRRKSYSRSPVHHSRRHHIKSVTPQKGNQNSEAKKQSVYSSDTDQKASGSGLGSNSSYHYSRGANFKTTNKKGFIHPSQKGFFKEKQKCFNCGKKGHCENDCNVDGKLCYNCHKITDHISVDCPMPRKVPKTNRHKIEATASLSSADSASTSETAIKSPQKSSAPKQTGRQICYKCGLGGHNINDCEVKGIYCYACQKIGDHKAIMCPSKIARGRGQIAGAKGDVDDSKLHLKNS